MKIVYVSPLKALSYDIERNLRAPLRGIGAELGVALRTGDTPQRERQAMRRNPPDILITTPESLYLIITSQAREMLTGVEAVIVDEIHAVAQSKRGAHLALTLERLSHLVTDEGNPEPQRIGLSATQRPLERIAEFLVGPKRECEIVDAGVRKELDLEIVVPVDDMTEPGAPSLRLTRPARTRSGGGGHVSPDRIDPGPIESSLDPVANPRSIWPAIYPELLRLVREHTSTIIFVNSRRGAERLAKRLNELHNQGDVEPELPATEVSAVGSPQSADEAADGGLRTADSVEEIARAHHGSLAHEERLVVEELLKSGRLPCLVATSSLELGIDMGAVDLVIQVESPKSVARGMQRVGRAGHQLGETSKGRIFPKFRADLLECAVVAKRMRAGEIEETVIPRNPLDVLAQHLVSMVADSEWQVDEVERVVTAAQPFSELSREQLENVLDMLDGRYPSEKFAELRPRVVWDRTAGTVRGRRGARQLAVTNAGTIPDRGLYGVHLPDGRRVGELDEEMVYEARPGQTFLLGATTWRIEDITRDRVIVTPAPGVPGAVPFWRGDGVGRPPELGRAIGAFAREAVRQDADTLAAENDLDQRAAANLVAYLREQQAATRVVPSDETLVVERFRDEIGDWRLCVLSPYGGRVHAAWGLALSARIRDELDLEAHAIWSDDGIVVHLPDADEPPDADLVLLEPDEVEDLVVRELGGSALFGARFRENASRSLLIPRAYPGKRTPLWQQRLKSQSLLEVARDFPRFPVILETYRECLRDVLDLPALVELLRDLQSRRISLVEVETQTASPFASSLLFDYVATYMYEGDTPNAERRAAALALDRELLSELLGADELRELIDPEALQEVERSLQLRHPDALAKDRDALQQVLRRLGDLTVEECEQRTAEGYSAESMLAKLERERRAAPVRIAGEERWIAAEDAGLYRDAVGVPPPGGLPDSFLAETPDAMLALVRRYARTHGPFPTAQITRRYGVDMSAALRELERSGELVRGELLPGGSEREWCDSDVLRRVRRASVAALRQEAEAVDPAELGRFLPAWQNVDAHRPAGAGPDRLREALVALQGVGLTPRSGSETCCRGASARTARPGSTSSPPAASSCGSAPARWRAPGGSPSTSARTCTSPAPAGEREARPSRGRGSRRDPRAARRLGLVLARPRHRPRLRARGAARRALGPRVGRRGDQRRLRAAPGPTPQRRAQPAPPGPALRIASQPEPGGDPGSLVFDRVAVSRRTGAGAAAAGAGGADAGALWHRHPRDRARRGRSGRILLALRGALEPRDARHGASRLLRRGPRRRPVRPRRRDRAAARDAPARGRVPAARRHRSGTALRRGPAVAETRRGQAPSRTPGAYVLLRDGNPIVYVERGGKGIVRLVELEGEALVEAIAHIAEAAREQLIPKLGIERVDGEPVIGSGLEEQIIAAGFSRQPRRLVATA